MVLGLQPFPSQHVFRSLRRQAAKEKQNASILALQLELAAVKRELLEWEFWWHSCGGEKVTGTCTASPHAQPVDPWSAPGADPWAAAVNQAEIPPRLACESWDMPRPQPVVKKGYKGEGSSREVAITKAPVFPVPQVQIQEVVKQVPRVKTRKIITQLPVPHVQTVGKAVEVQQVQAIEKTVSVPQMAVQTVEKQVPVTMAQEVAPQDALQYVSEAGDTLSRGEDFDDSLYGDGVNGIGTPEPFNQKDNDQVDADEPNAPEQEHPNDDAIVNTVNVASIFQQSLERVSQRQREEHQHQRREEAEGQRHAEAKRRAKAEIDDIDRILREAREKGEPICTSDLLLAELNAGGGQAGHGDSRGNPSSRWQFLKGKQPKKLQKSRKQATGTDDGEPVEQMVEVPQTQTTERPQMDAGLPNSRGQPRFTFIASLREHYGRKFSLRCEYCNQSMDPDDGAWLCTNCNSCLVHAESFACCKNKHLAEHAKVCSEKKRGVYLVENLIASEKQWIAESRRNADFRNSDASSVGAKSGGGQTRH